MEKVLLKTDLDAQDVEAICELYKEGFGTPTIGRKLGIYDHKVRRVIEASGLKRTPQEAAASPKKYGHNRGKKIL
jgi:hypothetical protein